MLRGGAVGVVLVVFFSCWGLFGKALNVSNGQGLQLEMELEVELTRESNRALVSASHLSLLRLECLGSLVPLEVVSGLACAFHNVVLLDCCVGVIVSSRNMQCWRRCC